MKKILIVPLLFMSILIMTGCNSEEKAKIEQEVIDFKPLQKYTEGRAEEYVVEKKTAEEIAGEVFKEQIGIVNNTETSFLISGNLDENLFIKSAVSDGSNLPTLTGLSDEAIQGLSGEDGDVWAEENATDYESLINNRTTMVESLDGNSEKQLTDSIQNAIDYQEKLADE